MAVCKECGRYTDPDDWPLEYRAIAHSFRNLCFECYLKNPDAIDPDSQPKDPDDDAQPEEISNDPVDEVDEDLPEDPVDIDPTDGEDEDEQDPEDV